MQIVELGFNVNCSNIVDQVASLKLVKSESVVQRVDQGYVDQYWISNFEIVYKDATMKNDSLSTQVIQPLESRGGDLYPMLLFFESLNITGTDKVCDF